MQLNPKLWETRSLVLTLSPLLLSVALGGGICIHQLNVTLHTSDQVGSGSQKLACIVLLSYNQLIQSWFAIALLCIANLEFLVSFSSK